MQDNQSQLALYQTKFNRNYLMQIQLNVVEFASISFPFTVEFNIQRTTTTSANMGEFKFTNLDSNLRKQLNQARYQTDLYKRVIFQAGYGENLSVIFIGNIVECYSYKNGADIITVMNVLDTGYGIYNGYSQRSFTGGMPLADIYRALMTDIPNSTLGAVGGQLDMVLQTNGTNDVTIRSSTYAGNTWAILSKTLNGVIFIDFEIINVLGATDVLENTLLPLITSDTGLLGTPILKGSHLEIEMLFEPRITVGQLVTIQSIISPQFNGSYRVDGLDHNGVISASVGGDCKTMLQLFIGNPQQPFQIVAQSNNT